MALTVKDRVKESSTTTGTADFVLGGAAAGFQTFAVIGNTNTTYYAAVDQATGDWEVGIGTYTSTGPTLTRDTVLESSNSGSKVSFAAGSKDVFCTYPAERSVYLDAAGSAVSVLDIGTLGASTANITAANITAGTVSTTPTNSTDLTNKQYVDTMVSSGITYHTPVKYEVPDSTGSLNATYNNGTAGVGATLTNAGTLAAFTPDGTVASVNDRIIVYNQTNAAQNGIYTVTTVGDGSTAWVLTRATDANTYATKTPNGLGEGDAFFIQSGLTGVGETYVCNTVGTITFGTTAITFAQVSDSTLYTAGTGLSLVGTEFSVTNTGSAGTYGGAGTVPVITTNAQGQVTGVTPTAITIGAAAVSGLAPSATTDTTNAANITSGTLPVARLNGSYTGITGVGTLTAGTWNGGAVDAAYGGTGQSSYAVGDLLYASTTTSLAKLADVVSGNALLSGGVGTAPAWGKVGLQTHVSGTLQIANGGTGATDAATARANLGAGTGNGSVTSVAAGSYLTGGTITTSGTLAVDATSANTASKVVARDASGNFSAGTVTANLTGTASGNLPLSGGTMSGVITTVSNGTAINFSGQSDSFGYNAAAGLGTYIKGAGNTYIYGGGKFYDGSTAQTLLHTGNYNSYSPTLTGGGASGTWSINVTGNAGSASSVAWGNITSRPSNIMFYEGFTLNADTMASNATGFTYASGAPYTGPVARFSTGGGYDLWLNAPYSGGNNIAFRTRNGDAGSLNSWRYPVVYDINGASGALYGTIYYDSNNTGYYCDPSSNSYLYNLILAGGGYFRPNNWIQLDGSYGLYWPNHYGAHLHANDLSTYTQIALRGGKNGYGGIYDQYSAVNIAMHDSGGNGGVYREANGRWFSYYHVGNDCWGFGTSNTSSAYNVYAPKGVYSGGRVDGTIFYDSNDTGYYCDPNGRSRLYQTSIVGGFQFSGRMCLTDSGSSLDNSTGMWLSENYGAVWNGSNGVTWNHQIINASSLLGFTGNGGNYGSGNLYATGNVIAYYSDERLKTKVSGIENALDKVRALEGFIYTENELAKSVGYSSSGEQAGVSAQRVKAVLPQAVSLAPFDMTGEPETGEIVSKSGENYLTVDYARLSPLLIEAIKEQDQEVVDLRARVSKLESLLSSLVTG